MRIEHVSVSIEQVRHGGSASWTPWKSHEQKFHGNTLYFSNHGENDDCVPKHYTLVPK